MTPRATTAARAIAPSRPTPAAPTLRPVPAAPSPARPTARPSASWWARLRNRLSPVGIAAGIVVVCLLAVVVGNMQLAAGQLRLSQLQSQVVAVESSEAAAQVRMTALESPAAVAAAVRYGGPGGATFVQPSEILTIPSVSLEKRLAPPTFSYAPCCSLTPGR